MMTLLALSLSIGLLIDDAIVVRENIVRHTELGKDHVTAALDGTKEIGLAVLATTLTIVAVFLPVAFMGVNWAFLLPVWGNCKYSCSYFYVYQFYTRPNAFSTLERPGKEKESRLQRFFNHISKLLDGLTHIYEKLLKLALRFRFITVIIAIASLVAALGLSKLIGTEFVPVPDKGEIRIQFETPVDASLEYTQAKLHQVDQIIRQFPDVVSTYGVVNSTIDSGKTTLV